MKKNFIPQYRFQSLLFSIVAMMLISGFLHDFAFLNWASDILFTLIILSALYALSNDKKHLWIGMSLGMLTLIATWYRSSAPQAWMLSLEISLDILFFAYIALVLGKLVLNAKEADSDTIFGAIALYMLIAIVWGFVYALLDYLHPKSLNLGQNLPLLNTYIYYSFATLSTVGYGDIVPHSPPAQVLSALEAVMGPLYLAIVISRFVAMMLHQKKSPTKGEEK